MCISRFNPSEPCCGGPRCVACPFVDWDAQTWLYEQPESTAARTFTGYYPEASGEVGSTLLPWVYETKFAALSARMTMRAACGWDLYPVRVARVLSGSVPDASYLEWQPLQTWYTAAGLKFAGDWQEDIYTREHASFAGLIRDADARRWVFDLFAPYRALNPGDGDPDAWELDDEFTCSGPNVWRYVGDDNNDGYFPAWVRLTRVRL